MSLKIAQVVCVYPPYQGGIGNSALGIARVLKSAGHDVKTLTLKSSLLRGVPSDGEAGCVDGGQVARLKAFPGFGNGGFIPQLFWRLKDFDLVYLHYPFFGAAEIVWFLKKFIWKNKTKLIVHFHMEPEFVSPLMRILSWPSRLIAPSLFKLADSIVCASLDYAQANMRPGIFNANKNKIKEIPFSVDTERFKPADSSQSSFDKLRTGGEAFKILFVGGLDKAHYFKGVNILLEAVAKIEKSPLLRGVSALGGQGVLGEFKKDWRLKIVGSGDLQTQYENKARELGIADKVSFAGRVSDEDLPQKYQDADCFVLPSINQGEAFGIVLLEAMASGLPVIASDLPGVRGVFTAASGLKIHPGDAEDLAEKIKYLIINSEIRKKMGEAARKEAEEKYDQEKISQRLLSKLNLLV